MSDNKQHDSTGTLKKQVISLVNAGQFETARETCQQACAQSPDDPEAWFLLGAINGQLTDWAAAEAACRQATRLAPQHPVSHYNLAIALLQQHRPAEAIDELVMADKLQPDHFNTLLELGNTYNQTGHHELAIFQLSKALELQPESAVAHVNLAHAFREALRYEPALLHYRRAIELDPDNPEAYYELAGVFIAQFKYDSAISLLESVIPRMPGKTGLLSRLAVAYQEQGDSDKARHYYNRALEIEPDHLASRIGITGIQAMQGDFSNAFHSVEKLLAEHPENLSALLIYANIAHHFGADDKAAELVTKRLADPSVPEKTQSKLYFALANIHERSDDLDKAFECYKTANRLRGAVFDYISYSNIYNALIENYSVQAVPSLPRSDNRSDTPIFIVGMPRSGTSLAEQIIASHPDAFGAGELSNLNYIVASLNETIHSSVPYPRCLDQLDTPLLNRLADQYLAEIAERSGNARFVTDKMPMNFMHLGFIDLLFPNAHIIHCQRDPLDTCLSCYFQSFSGEQPYAYSLTDLGKHYRLYRKLMEHWKKVLRVPMYELSYEALVGNQEEETRKLLEFCGIEWNDACLNFHKTQRTVSTASYSQVRNPIYRKSVGRWRAFEKHLGPLLEELQKPG